MVALDHVHHHLVVNLVQSLQSVKKIIELVLKEQQRFSIQRGDQLVGISQHCFHDHGDQLTVFPGIIQGFQEDGGKQGKTFRSLFVSAVMI